MGRTEIVLKDSPKDEPRTTPHPSHLWIGIHRHRLPARGSKWRHYKGRTVTVLAVGVREETGRIFVAYEEEGGEVWDRLLHDWSDTVSVDDVIVPRFREIRDGSD